MFPFAHVVHFLAHEFASLGRRCLAGAPGCARSLHRLFLRHIESSDTSRTRNHSATIIRRRPTGEHFLQAIGARTVRPFSAV
jgi:hypothetical protein